MLDLLIKNAKIIDGSGRDRFTSDIGIRDGVISVIDNNITEEADKVIMANNQYVCPGFIDAHSHVDLELINYSTPINKIRQGVTTEIAGQCGYSLFPVYPQLIETFENMLLSTGIKIKIDWNSAEDFINRLSKKGIGTNYIPLTGHGTLRLNAVGLSKDANQDQIDNMKDLLSKTFEQGSWGLSLGLEYPPGCFASTYELIELSKVIAKYDKVLTVHLRNQDERFIESVEEIIHVARESKARVAISHLKASGADNWGKVKDAIKLIDEARKDGNDISFDFYPYDGSFSFLSIFLPTWCKANGNSGIIKSVKNDCERQKIIDYIESKKYDYSGIIISQSHVDELKQYEGMSIINIADQLNMNCVEVILDLIIKDPSIYAIYRSVSMKDIKDIVNTPYSIVGSDSFITIKSSDKTHCHPRNFATFPKFIKKYAIDSKLITIEEAIAKITGMTADTYRIQNRGYIKKGYMADLVIMDIDRLDDRANYKNPMEFPVGINYVIINGEVQLEYDDIRNNMCGVTIN